MTDPGDLNRPPDVGTGARPPRELPEFLQGDGPPGGSLGGIFGALRPPPPVEPYIPLGSRPPAQWGKPDGVLSGARNYPGALPGPFMPQQGDVRGLLQGALGTKGGLGSIGSPLIRALASGSLRINDRFIKDFIAGRETAMKLADAQMKRQLEEVDLKQQQESERYGTIIDYYKGNNDEMRKQLRAAAVELGDTQGPMSMISALDSGDMTAPERLIAARDKHWLSLAKYRQQQSAIEAQEERTKTAKEKRDAAEKARAQTEEDLRKAGIDPSKALPPVTVDPAPSATLPPVPESSEEPAAPAAPEREPAESGDEPLDTGPSWITGQAAPAGPPQPAAAAAPQPIQQAQELNPEEAPPYQVAGLNWTGPPVQSTAAAEIVPETVSGVPVRQAQAAGQPLQINPRIGPGQADQTPDREMTQVDRWAEDKILGGKGFTKTGRKDFDAPAIIATDRREQDMRTQIDRVMRDPRFNQIKDPAARQAAVANAVRAISPRIGNAVDMLVNGQLRLRTTKQYRDYEIPLTLAAKADPTFNPGNPEQRANTLRSFGSGQDGRTLTSMATAGPPALP